MRFTRYFALLLAVLIPSTAPAQAKYAMPPPRWQAALYKPPINYPLYIQCMPVGSVLVFAHYSKIVALDRASGRELWRRSDLTEKVIGGDITKRQPLAPPAAGNLADYAGEIVRTYWQPVATGAAEPGGPIAILREHQEHIVPDNSRPNKQRTADENNDEVAIQAITGQELWRRPIDHDYYFMTVAGNLLIDYQPRAEQAQSSQPLHLRYRDLATGLPLEANSRKEQDAIQAETNRQGKDLLLVQSFSDLYRLDLKAETATPLYHARSYLLSYALFAPQGRITIYNNPDDDGAGHSVWPCYVDGTDLNGKQVWRFPKVLQTLGVDDPKTIREPYSIAPMAPCRAVGSVLCVSGWSLGGAGKPLWYGLDVRDGSVRWKFAIKADRPIVIELGRGILCANSSGTDSSLAWIDGRNGKVYRIGRTPPVIALFVSGDDLLLLDPQGNLVAYSLKAVLPATIRRLVNGS
jgi:outer membrane protein assembly factor BamB